MHIDSRDLIVSVSISRNDYYKSKIPNGCCITIAIQRLLKTLENPELESSCPVSCGSYTAPDIVIVGATKKNVLNFGTPDMQHENLHNRFCVCVQVMRVSPPRREKSDFWENGYFQRFERNGKKPSTWNTSQICRKYRHGILVFTSIYHAIYLSIYLSIYHVTVKEVTS